MPGDVVSRFSAAALFILSLTAPLAVISGYFQPLQKDEGWSAHIFQIAVIGLAPVGAVYLATGDLRRPGAVVRALAAPAALVGLSFGLLFVLEHDWFAAR